MSDDAAVAGGFSFLADSLPPGPGEGSGGVIWPGGVTPWREPPEAVRDDSVASEEGSGGGWCVTPEAELEMLGLEPSEWETVGVKSSQWGSTGAAPSRSIRYTFAKTGSLLPEVPLEELEAAVRKARASTVVRDANPPRALILALGDMQFGKADKENAGDAYSRTVRVIDLFAEQVRERGLVGGWLHVAWLGDHVEGFQSQGGGNLWRTKLPLTDQIRMCRQVMMYAAQVLAPLAGKLTMVAVPGNHGEAVRFGNKMATSYSDSFDTDALRAVQEALSLNPDAFGHVSCRWPEEDELLVVQEVAGLQVLHAHGHQYRPNQHFQWWQKQAFHQEDPQGAGLMLAGHLHHEHLECQGRRWFMQPGALENVSQWWKHRNGVGGNPGALLVEVQGGEPVGVSFLRPRV